MIFWLGTQYPRWLARAGVPLFISRRALARCKTPPQALAPWALDSGGFSELSMHGRWLIRAATYADECHRWMSVGKMAWAACQDWMCEPIIREGGWTGKGKHRRLIPGTHLSVREHQERTTTSYLELQALAPEVPWIPVLQGWEVRDYLHHLALYERDSVDLRTLPVVGIGSICRRQATRQAEGLIAEISSHGIRLHAFGFKLTGLAGDTAARLVSADSMAWSYAARRDTRLPGCTHKGKCNHCLTYALQWREKVLASITQGQRRHEPGFWDAPTAAHPIRSKVYSFDDPCRRSGGVFPHQ